MTSTPKGWKKIRNEYVHNSLDAFVRIFKVANKKGTMTPPRYQIVTVPRRGKSKSKTFKTRSQAMKFAFNYMKKHPRG